MARTAGKDPGVMKAKKTPRPRRRPAKSSGQLGQGSREERTVRPDKAKANGARTTKKSRRSHSESSDNLGTFDMSDDDECLPSMQEKQRESGATSPTAISEYRNPPAVRRARNGSTGGGGSQQVSAPATDDEACQPPTMSAPGTRKRKSKGGGGTSGDGTGGGRQRRNKTKRGAAALAPAAPAAATTASTTGSTTSSGPARPTRRTTSGGGSTGGGGTGISPPASTTTPSPSSTASSDDVPATREDIVSKIRDQLTPEQQGVWDATTGGDSWTPSQGPVGAEDVESQADISELKKKVTKRDVPKNAAGVGPVVFQEGAVWDTLTCKILAFPVNAQHFMGGPNEYKGKNAAVVWGNNVYWLGEDGELINGQCCTAHYLGQVMQRCGLDRVFVCDASGVAHPRAGSGLKKGNPGTRELVAAHVQYLLGSGRRMLEVHSRGTTLRFLEVLEGMATAGNADIRIKIGSGNVRVHVFFGVPCGPSGEPGTVVLFGTDHHSMMRWSFVANSIVRSQIAASALAGKPLTQAQTDEVWAMSTTGTMSPEEWTKWFADLLNEMGPELLAKFEQLVEQEDGDMDRAYQRLTGWKGGMAAPTTKAKKGGEWETAVREGREEEARLGAAPRTRGNAKAVATLALDIEEVSKKLEAQYRRWELSVGAMHFGNATNYATYLEAKKTSQDANATLAQQEKASAVVATMEKEKTERLSAQGKNSWTSQTAGKTVSGAAEKEAAAGQALSAAKTRTQKATAEEALESATAELAVVTEARQRRSDGGRAGANTAWVKDGKMAREGDPGAVKTTSGGAALKGNASWTGRSRGLNEEEAEAAVAEAEKARAAAPEDQKAEQVVAAAIEKRQLAETAKKRRRDGGRAGDVTKRKKKGRGGSDAPARGGGGTNAAVTLSMVTRVDRVTPEVAGFTHVRCAFINAKGERCTEVREWDRRAVKDHRCGGDGAWVAVVPTHQPTIKGKRVHSAAFEPWKKIGEAVDDGECLVGSEGVKYLSSLTASRMVTAKQTAFQEYLASET